MEKPNQSYRNRVFRFAEQTFVTGKLNLKSIAQISVHFIETFSRFWNGKDRKIKLQCVQSRIFLDAWFTRIVKYLFSEASCHRNMPSPDSYTYIRIQLFLHMLSTDSWFMLSLTNFCLFILLERIIK